MSKMFFQRLDGRIALLVFSIILGTLSIYGREVSPHDEQRVAGIAREMIIDGDYLQPRLNGVPFNEYPFLGYLPFVTVFRLFGTHSPYVAHLPGILLATATVWLTFLLGRQLGGKRLGLVAGFSLQMTAGFVSLSRNITVDPALLFAVTLSLYGFLAACDRPSNRTPYLMLFYAAMAAGFLVKGMIGAGIPVAVACTYLLVRRDTHTLRMIFFHPTVLCFAFPLLLWIGVCAISGSTNTIRDVLLQSLFRFISYSADHNQPFYYYCLKIFNQLAPWSFVILPLFWLQFGPEKQHVFNQGKNVVFPLVWFCTVFFLLSMASAKRATYLGPIYPAFSILFAMAWERLRKVMRFPLAAEVGLPVFALIVFAVLQIFVIQPDTAEDSHRALFAKAESVKAPISLYLDHPNESLLGGAVFYLGRTVPVLSSEEEILSLLDEPGAKAVLAFLQSEPPDCTFILQQAKRVKLLMKKYGRGGKEYRLYSILPRASGNV